MTLNSYAFLYANPDEKLFLLCFEAQENGNQVKLNNMDEHGLQWHILMYNTFFKKLCAAFKCIILQWGGGWDENDDGSWKLTRCFFMLRSFLSWLFHTTFFTCSSQRYMNARLWQKPVLQDRIKMIRKNAGWYWCCYYYFCCCISFYSFLLAGNALIKREKKGKTYNLPVKENTPLVTLTGSVFKAFDANKTPL